MPRLPWLVVVAAAALVTTATTAAIAGTSVVFSRDEVTIIRDFYAHAPQDAAGKGAPKDSKRKGKPLPPGIAKNLQRGKPLPPGIARQQLPAELVRQLPPVRSGYERVVVDGRVLLVEVATQMIHDALEDLLR